MNEEYGQFLLRQLAAVAPLSRPEDFGVDAIATLLPKRGLSLVAADSFLVQFKSSSIKKVDYSKNGPGHGGIEWLRSLQLPLFFGVTSDVENNLPGRLKLYSTQQLMLALMLHPWIENISVCFEPQLAVPSKEQQLQYRNSESDQSAAMSQSKSTNDNIYTDAYETFLRSFDTLVLWLGDPILEFDQVDAHNAEQREHLISVLSTWIQTGYDNITNAMIGQYALLGYIKNEHPTIQHQQMPTREPSPEATQRIKRSFVLSSFSYMIERLYHGTRKEVDELMVILEDLKYSGEDVHINYRSINATWLKLQQQREAYRAAGSQSLGSGIEGN